MWLSILSVAGLLVTALFVIYKAKSRSVRQMAFLPALMLAMEIVGCGMLRPEAFPLLTGLLTVARLTVVGCCAAAVHRDRKAYKARMRRQKRMLRLHTNASSSGLSLCA